MKLSLPVYAVAAKEFVVLADCIAAAYNKIGLKVPTKIIRSLDRAIALRKDHALWFPHARLGIQTEDGHTFFIGVLERVKKVLTQCMPTQNEVSFVAKSSSKSEAEGPDLAQIDNFFKHLTVEEPPEAFLEASSVVAPHKPESHDGPRFVVVAERPQTTGRNGPLRIVSFTMSRRFDVRLTDFGRVTARVISP